jgi:hypothetical protein
MCRHFKNNNNNGKREGGGGGLLKFNFDTAKRLSCAADFVLFLCPPPPNESSNAFILVWFRSESAVVGAVKPVCGIDPLVVSEVATARLESAISNPKAASHLSYFK